MSSDLSFEREREREVHLKKLLYLKQTALENHAYFTKFIPYIINAVVLHTRHDLSALHAFIILREVILFFIRAVNQI